MKWPYTLAMALLAWMAATPSHASVWLHLDGQFYLATSLGGSLYHPGVKFLRVLGTDDMRNCRRTNGQPLIDAANTIVVGRSVALWSVDAATLEYFVPSAGLPVPIISVETPERDVICDGSVNPPESVQKRIFGLFGDGFEHD